MVHSKISELPIPPLSMEEVWKEIRLTSLDHNRHHHHYHTSAAAAVQPPPIAGLTLHEFLASPFSTPSPSSSSSSSSSTTTTISIPILPVLHPQRIKTQPEKNPTSNGIISFCPFPQKKRGSPGDDDNAINRKKNRLMKNRESAARSRAKKQAYTYELELEVTHLMKENTKLKKQKEQLCSASANGYQQKKHRLNRSLTAPF